MSLKRILQVATAQFGSDWMVRTSSWIQSGEATSASWFSNRTYSSRTDEIARLYPALNPRFRSKETTSTDGNRDLTKSTVPSWLALSATTTRYSGYREDKTLPKQASMKGRPL